MAFNEYVLTSFFQLPYVSTLTLERSKSIISDKKTPPEHFNSSLKNVQTHKTSCFFLRKFKLSISWQLDLSHKSLGIRSASQSSTLCLGMRSLRRSRLGERDRRRSLGLPHSFGKSRQVALSSREDSIINDASTLAISESLIL